SFNALATFAIPLSCSTSVRRPRQRRLAHPTRGLDDANEHEGTSQPKQWLECVHRKPVVDGQKAGCDENGQRRQSLGKAPPAQLPCDQTSQQYSAGSRERWEEANRLKGITEQCTRDLRDQSDEWRLVHIAPSQVLSTRQVVEFVNKIAVVAACV